MLFAKKRKRSNLLIYICNMYWLYQQVHSHVFSCELAKLDLLAYWFKMSDMKLTEKECIHMMSFAETWHAQPKQSSWFSEEDSPAIKEKGDPHAPPTLKYCKNYSSNVTRVTIPFSGQLLSIPLVIYLAA